MGFIGQKLYEIVRIKSCYLICIAALNQVLLLGRVGISPEMRGTEEHPVVTFSLATHTNYRKGEGNISTLLLPESGV